MTFPRIAFVALCMAASGWAVASMVPPRELVSYGTSATPVPSPVPAPEPHKGSVRLRFVGDVMLSRSVGDAMARRNDWTWPFASVASAMRGPDLMVANLETTISSRGATNGCGYCFRADPKAVSGLTFAGIDVVSLANNHAWDYGLPALEDTLSYLASAGIDAVGAGTTAIRARSPVVREVNGTRIAFLAYTDLLPESAIASDVRAGVNRFSVAFMQEDISRARKAADVVVVLFHAGTEYELLHNPSQERHYRAAIDAGADLVIGHHPHVVQDWERYGRGWIFYSLGNFIFDQNWSDQTKRGLMVDVLLDGGAIAGVATASVDISSAYQPVIGALPSDSDTMRP